MQRDKSDVSRSYRFVLKDAKTPSWCIRIIATGFFGAGSHLTGKMGMKTNTQKLLVHIFMALFFFVSKNVMNY